MSEFEMLTSTIALSMGVAWASGINLYAALLVLGIGGSTGNIALPPELLVLEDPMVIGAAGLMYFVEFFADKTPGVDTGWDGIHTFIRIPAGALLAASAVGDVTPALEITAGILGGSMSAASHATKAGTRLMINTSPEPFSNWTASITEDVAVIGGLWAALNYPVAFMVFLVLFIIFMIWFLPKIWRGIKLLFRKIGEWLGFIEKTEEQSESASQQNAKSNSDALEKISQLKSLLDDGAITPDEFEHQKKHLLELSLNSPSSST
ncbi:MAG: DUF4126 family protein [Pseudomonadales bacterium]|nr:DUF4126 family protein [Pseudomonadales bacterium]